MTSEVRSGLCPQADKTWDVVIPIFNSLHFEHALLCNDGGLVGWSSASESVDASCSRDPAHALRHMHVAAANSRTGFPARWPTLRPISRRSRLIIVGPLVTMSGALAKAIHCMTRSGHQTRCHYTFVAMERGSKIKIFHTENIFLITTSHCF
jgi:hypothetical protein